jgi:hypothetical protein
MTCWEYNNCPKDKYKECLAYPHNGQDCWVMTGKKYNCGKSEASSLVEKLSFCKTNCNFFKTYINKF